MNYPNQTDLVAGKFGQNSELTHQSFNQLYDELIAVISVNAVPNATQTQLLTAINAIIATALADLPTAAAVQNINTLLTSNDVALDTLQELVDYAKLNRANLQSLVVNWADVANKPLTFPPAVHTHDYAAITGDSSQTFAVSNANADTDAVNLAQMTAAVSSPAFRQTGIRIVKTSANGTNNEIAHLYNSYSNEWNGTGIYIFEVFCIAFNRYGYSRYVVSTKSRTCTLLDSQGSFIALTLSRVFIGENSRFVLSGNATEPHTFYKVIATCGVLAGNIFGNDSPRAFTNQFNRGRSSQRSTSTQNNGSIIFKNLTTQQLADQGVVSYGS